MNDRLPLVCVCVPTYNSEKTLAETLNSILSQTYRNLSVLVVDNASTDGTLKIANGYATSDKRLGVIRNSENVGGEGNFTRCLSLACGEYTAIFHSDDVYAPGIVAEEVAFLEAHREAGAVFPMAQSIDGRGTPGRIYRFPPELRGRSPAVYGFDEVFRALLKYGNFFFCPGVMARTMVYKDYVKKWDAGGYNTSADLDVWLRILLLGKIGLIDKPLLLYRGAASTSFSFSAARKNTSPHDMLRVFEAYIKGPAAALMGEQETECYRFLVLKDNVNRAFNYFVSGDASSGRALLERSFSFRDVVAAFNCGVWLKTLLYGYVVYFLSWLPLWKGARGVIASFRYKV